MPDYYYDDADMTWYSDHDVAIGMMMTDVMFPKYAGVSWACH